MDAAPDLSESLNISEICVMIRRSGTRPPQNRQSLHERKKFLILKCCRSDVQPCVFLWQKVAENDSVWGLWGILCNFLWKTAESWGYSLGSQGQERASSWSSSYITVHCWTSMLQDPWKQRWRAWILSTIHFFTAVLLLAGFLTS